MPIEVKNTQLAEVQDHKGTLFENFLRGLFTNGKPVFWALDQWEAPISFRFLLLAKSGVYQSNDNQPIDRHLGAAGVPMQCNAKWNLDFNWLPRECLAPNQMPIDNQSRINWQPIWMQIDNQLNANQQLIWCKSTTNMIRIDNQSDANQKTNLMPINIQSDAN